MEFVEVNGVKYEIGYYTSDRPIDAVKKITTNIKLKSDGTIMNCQGTWCDKKSVQSGNILKFRPGQKVLLDEATIKESSTIRSMINSRTIRRTL